MTAAAEEARAASERGDRGGARSIDFRFAPPRTWTAICRADDPDKSLVDERGALLYGFRGRSFEAWSFDRVVAFAADGAAAAGAVRQRTESPRRGIVVTELDYERQRLTLTAFADVDDTGARRDVVLWELVCTDDPGAGLPPLLTGLRIDLFDRASPPLTSGAAPSRLVRELPAGAEDRLPTWIDDTRIADPADGAIRFVSTQPLLPAHTDRFLPGAAFVAAQGVLRPGERRSGALVVPLEAPAPPAEDAWAEGALGRTRAYWDGLLLRTHTLELPDPDVQAMVDAAARNILQAREVVDGVPQLQVGPAVYRGLWIVDGHFLMECARYLGLDDAADAAMEALLRRVRPDGSIVESVQVPHLKETAVALASLVREAELLGDVERLRRRWPLVEAAVAYLDGLRRQAQELPADHPLHGVLPVAFADGGLAGERAELTTVLWTLVGLRYVADAAPRVDPEGADAHRQRYESLRAAFEARLGAWGETSGDGIVLPMLVAGSGDHHYVPDAPGPVPPQRRANPLTGSWALCQAVWPGELFPPEHPVVRGLLRQLEDVDDEEGIPAETGWLPYRALWTYYASFAAHAWLAAGRPDKAVDYLYAFANHAAPTRVWREEQSLRSSGHSLLCGDMPHNWASAELIRLVCHLLVFEQGSTLALLPALPPEWTGAVRLAEHPTRFGRVSLALDVADADGRDLDVSLGGPAYAAADRVRVRLPAGCGSASLRDGTDLPAVDGWVELPPGGRWSLRLR